MSFIVLLFALYTVAGGILVTAQIKGDPDGGAVDGPRPAAFGAAADGREQIR